MNERFKYQMVSIGSMNKQINIRMPENILIAAERYAKKNGFASMQDLIKEAVREKVYDEPEFTANELALIRKFVKVTEKHGLYGTEEDFYRLAKK